MAPPSPSRGGVDARGLISAVLINACMGSLYAWSIFVDPLIAELGTSRTAVSAVFSIAVASFAASMALLPRYAFRFRAGQVASGALVIAISGLVLSAAAQALWAVWIGYGFLFGIANGLGYALALQLATRALPARRGLASGLAVSAYALGPALLAPVLQYAIVTLGVWPAFAVIAGLLATVWAIVSALLSRHGDAVSGADTKRDSTDGPAAARLFSILWFGFLFGSMAGLAILGHAAGLVADHGGSAVVISIGVAGISALNGVGRLSSGWLSDHLPVKSILFAGPMIGVVVLAVFSQWPMMVTAVLCLLGAGLSYGLVAAGYAAAVSHLYGRDRVGIVFGRLMTAWGVAGLIAPVLAGYVLDLSGLYQRVALLACAFAAASAMLSLLLPVNRRG